MYPPSVASNAAGNYVVVWSTDFADHSSEIDGQRYCASGTPMGSQFTISKSTSPSVELIAPNVAINIQGEFVVTWFNIQNFTTNNPTYSIHAQRFNFLGKAQGTELAIGNSAYPDNLYINSNNVGIDSNGDFVVIRESPHNVGDFIYAQVYNWSGSLKGNQITVASGNGTSTFADTSTATMDSKGDFVVAWHNLDTVSDSVMARRYNLAGKPTSNLITVVTGSNNTFHSPVLAIDSIGAFVVAWDQYDPNVGDSIHAQRYDSLGHASGSAITVFRVDSNSFRVGFPTSVAMNTVGDFVVSWFVENFSNSFVYAHAYKSSGQSDGGQMTVAQGDSKSFPVSPSVAMNGCGKFVIVWSNQIPQTTMNTYKFKITAQQYRN